jgi:hypothetical protein
MRVVGSVRVPMRMAGAGVRVVATQAALDTTATARLRAVTGGVSEAIRGEDGGLSRRRTR